MRIVLSPMRGEVYGVFVMAPGGTAVKAESQSDIRTRTMRPVDLVHLAKQCLGDEGLELEVLRLFDTTIKDYYGRLQMAASFDDLTLVLHSIKGAAGGVGAWAVADLAKAMEHEIRNGRPLTQERIDDLGLVVGDVRDFIGRMVTNEAV